MNSPEGPAAAAAVSDFLRRERLPESFWADNGGLYDTVAGRIAAMHRHHGRPLVVGLCGPQGSGKSTSAMALRLLLEEKGLRSCILSLDDFYLTRAERQRLAQEVHPLLATRGPPGTHDLDLGMQLVGALRCPGPTHLPVFHKATDDRAPKAAWPVFEGPADVILFEGWCVGAVPQAAAALAEPVNELEAMEDAAGGWRTYVNEALTAYQALFAQIDYLLLLQPPSFEVVFGWRCEQEQKLRDRSDGAAGLRIMSDTEIRRFIQHYERLTRYIMDEMPARADTIVDLDARRVSTLRTAARRVYRFDLSRAASSGRHVAGSHAATPPTYSRLRVTASADSLPGARCPALGPLVALLV